MVLKELCGHNIPQLITISTDINFTAIDNIQHNINNGHNQAY